MRRKLILALSLIPLAITLFILIKAIYPAGYLKYIDVTDPLNVQHLYQRYVYTYSDDIGDSIAEKQRIPLFSLIFTAFKVTTLGDDAYVKVKIVMLFVLTFIICASVNYKLLKHIAKDETHPLAKGFLPIALLSSTYYITSFWFTNRIMHFGLFFSTCTVPLTFYFIYTFLYSEKLDIRKLLLLLVFTTIFSATPHSAMFIFFITGSLSAAYLISSSDDLKHKFQRILCIGLFAALYVPINFNWIYPYIQAAPFPDAIPGETIIAKLSAQSTIPNALKLMGYWIPQSWEYFLTLPFMEAVGSHFLAWLPLVAFLIALGITRKNKYVVIPLLCLLIATTLFASYEPYTKNILFWIIFKSPISGFGWLLREPDKFGLILSYLYSVGFCIAIVTVPAALKRASRIATGAIVSALVLVIAMNSAYLWRTLHTYYNPQQVPQSFFDVNKLLTADTELFNVVWYPPIVNATWSNTEDVRYQFTNMISAKPSITTRSDLMNYMDFVFDPLNINNVHIGQSLNNVGVKYLVLRKDTTDETVKELATTLNSNTDITLIHTDEYLNVYENKKFSGITNYYTNRLLTDKGNAILWERDLENKVFIDFTDKPSNLNSVRTYYELSGNKQDALLGKYATKFIFPFKYTTDKETGNPGTWTFGTLDNITHAEIDFFFDDLGLDLNQFDYGRGFVMARDGYMKEINSKASTELPVAFSAHTNLQVVNKNTLEYTSIPSDLIYEWNTIRSDKNAVNGTKALEIHLKSNIAANLTPHYKITYYDANMAELHADALYPDDRSEVNYVLKMPNANFYDFSIWTKSQSTGYTYKITDLELKDITNQVKPIELAFTHTGGCTVNCTIMARVLKNARGGSLGIQIDDTKFTTSTFLDKNVDTNNRFEWVNLGTIKNLDENIDVKLQNLEGVNAVNALVLLTSEEYNLIQSQIISTNMEPLGELPRTPNTQFNVYEINPTKYKVTVQGTNNTSGVLTFSKPFSKNWTINKVPASVVNGYINGWYINSDGTYTIEYSPQAFFERGQLVSLITLLVVIGTYAFISVRLVIKSERISKSQG